MFSQWKKTSFLLSIILLALLCIYSGCRKKDDNRNVFRTSINKLIATLDPALAADTASQFMTASFYDTPLQYSFSKRPYVLEPSMLETMPEFSSDGTVMTCRLRDDLYFQNAPCFPDKASRKVTAQDVIFSILRLADARVHSTGYWLIRGRIKGLDSFRSMTLKTPENDFSPYDKGCSGMEVVDERTFKIHLTSADPRFVYAMAMPYFSVVSRKAVEHYGKKFSDNPCGSGPFILKSWQKDHQIRLVKNSEYRTEYFKDAENTDDRNRKLPLCEEIVCDLVKQPMAGWLLFLQGELDSYALDGENFAAVVNKQMQIPASLQKRGIQLQRAPEMQINYIGFSFADPLLGKNENLRKAISLAFNRDVRIEYGAGKLYPAHGPVPPDAGAGFLAEPGTFTQRNIPLAKEYMEKAGFPGGIDPRTGKPLEITFDQAGSDTFYLQTAELLAIDLAEIGIKVKPEFNNRARFLQKLANNQVQMFRLSWTGDYPDAENFLQLFYGPNSGASNRVSCDLQEINLMYEKIKNMQPSAARDQAYAELAELIRSKCPWIFESFTVSFMLKHCWLENMRPHDFAFQRWKYISVNPQKRNGVKRGFEPLSLKELRGE